MPKAPTITSKQFARLLKGYRERHQLTQNETAAKLGVSVRTLRKKRPRSSEFWLISFDFNDSSF